MSRPAELGGFRLRLPSGGTTLLSEVADIVDGTEELRESSTRNGESVIGLSINKRSDGNTVQIAKDVEKALAELKGVLDPDIQVKITDNSATFVQAPVSDVMSNVMIGILLTALLLLLFLHNWQQTVVAPLSMPISIVATFLLMQHSGFSLNVMTLLGLGISIGTLVTNSVVILENITRYLAIILIYVVIAALMESFIHPLTIMITLPLGLIGVAMSLFIFGETINIFSLMSVVMLSGIVVNNAILMLDFTAQLRAKGMRIKEALIEASATRLRPIIMANLAIVIGIIPQLIFGGAGVELRAPMAVVQIGGIIVSTIFTLFIIPIAYTIMDKLTPVGRRER